MEFMTGAAGASGGEGGLETGAGIPAEGGRSGRSLEAIDGI